MAGQIPGLKIFETDHAFAFLDAYPSSYGHSLLIPKADGIGSLADLSPETAGKVLRELPRLYQAVIEATGCDGANIVQNNGAYAGQTVFHLHFHVIPRYDGDGGLGAVLKRRKKLDNKKGQDLLDRIISKLQPDSKL